MYNNEKLLDPLVLQLRDVLQCEVKCLGASVSFMF